MEKDIIIKTKYLIIFSLIISFGNQVVAQDTLPLFSKAPLFTAFDSDNNLISLDSLLKKGPVIINFYRGQWCPYCNRHMSNLQDSLTYIVKFGASIVAITPENNTEINKTVKKTEASFSIIYDEGHKIMDAYEVTFRNSNIKNIMHLAVGININKASGNTDNALPVPATYIIAQDGRIIGRQFDTDYTKRMSVLTILDILKESANLK